MELLNHLALGFSTALSLQNLAYALLGCVLGTLIGVLPGLGPLATIAMLLPITYTLPPVAALIMLAGIYYGAQYGGSTTAILVNLPGESSSVVTTLDGYQMARKGRAGVALATAGLGSFFAGSVATLILAGPGHNAPAGVFHLAAHCAVASASQPSTSPRPLRKSRCAPAARNASSGAIASIDAAPVCLLSFSPTSLTTTGTCR